MTKRFICLLLAVLMFAALPIAGVYAAGEDIEVTVGAETMKQICEKNGLDYNFCKDAIIALNPSKFTKEDDFKNIVVGWKIKIPKTNQDAADILGVELPSNLLPKSTGETQDYVVKDKDTMISICKAKGLDYTKCKDAILKLNGWSDYNLLTLHVGDKIKLPKTDTDAAVISKTATATATGTTTSSLFVSDGAVAAYMVPYIVKTGDTIYSICLANGVDFNRYVNLIMQASGITYATDLHTGDVIFLPSSTATSGSMSIVTHIVKGGETVYGICQSLGIDYNSNINLITTLNQGKNLSSIHTGDVLFFPKGSTGTGTGTGTGAGTGTGTGSGGYGGYGGGYTPASPETPVTQKTPKATEGFMFALKEVTIVADDTVYNLLTKTEGMSAEYYNYYVNVMLGANNRGSFNNLKAGEKILIATKTAGGAKIVVKGVKVKTGDTVIKMCTDNGINYDEVSNLIAKLNPNLNVNNLHVDDIVLLPFKP